MGSHSAARGLQGWDVSAISFLVSYVIIGLVQLIFDALIGISLLVLNHVCIILMLPYTFIYTPVSFSCHLNIIYHRNL